MRVQGLSPAYRLAFGLLRPLFMTFTKRDWRGTEHLPATGGMIACSNHMSYVDPFTFAHFLLDNGRTPFFLGKAEVFRIPVVGAILRGAGQIPVHRETGDAAAAFASAVEAIAEGRCIALYPEGTLTRDPDLWPMVGKTGAARLALATGCPVIPVAQWGPQQILMPYGKRLRVLPRKTVHVLAGPAVDLEDLRAGPADAGAVVEAAARITDAVTSLLEQLRGVPAPQPRFDPRDHDLPRTGNPLKAAREVQRRAAREARRRVHDVRRGDRHDEGRTS